MFNKICYCWIVAQILYLAQLLRMPTNLVVGQLSYNLMISLEHCKFMRFLHYSNDVGKSKIYLDGIFWNIMLYMKLQPTMHADIHTYKYWCCAYALDQPKSSTIIHKSKKPYILSLPIILVHLVILIHYFLLYYSFVSLYYSESFIVYSP